MDIFILVQFISSIVCMFLARTKDRSMGIWLIIGLIFGFVALVVLAFLPEKEADENGPIASYRKKKQIINKSIKRQFN